MSGADSQAIREHLVGQMAQSGLMSPESELALIGAALCAPTSCEDAFASLPARAFAEPVLGRIWAAAAKLSLGGRGVSAVFVRDALGIDPDFAEWGGLARLEDLAETGTGLHVDKHAAAVADRHSRRALRTLLNDMSAKIGDTGAGDAATLIADLERGAAEIAQHGVSPDHWTPAGAALAAAIEHALTRRGSIEFPYGIAELDRRTGGLNAGETTILGAYTGMGKTIGALQVAKANAMQGKGVCYYSLEMANGPMAIRLACDLLFDRQAMSYSGATTNITIDRALKGDLQPHEVNRMRDVADRIGRWPLVFDETPGRTVAEIEALARRQHRKWRKAGIKPGPVIIDHIGKVRPSRDRRGDKTAELADVSNDLLSMAKRLAVPVVALAQLNREVNKSEDKVPTLGTIKQAAAIEEDARQVILLYRPEYYFREPFEHEDLARKSERLEKLQKVEKHFYWLIEKNSNGPPGRVLSYCEAACSAVRDWNP